MTSECKSFVEQMLCPEASKRASPQELLEHPFLADVKENLIVTQEQDKIQAY